MRCVAGNNPYFTADYFTTVTTAEYLESLPREFEIPADIFLVILGSDDMPSRPPENHVTLSADFFQAGLRLLFHPFFHRTPVNLHMALIQLNLNSFRTLLCCYLL